MKKLLLLLLVAISTFPAMAYVGETMEIDGITYEIRDESNLEGDPIKGYCRIISTSGNLSGHVAIPYSVTYNDKIYAVYAISAQAFKDCDKITSILIPDKIEVYDDDFGQLQYPGIFEIGDQAFEGCIGLTSISIPPSVDHFGWEVFKDCSNLTNIVWTMGFHFLIQSNTFFTDSNNSLESITIFNFNDTNGNRGGIGSQAFMNFSNLKSADLQGVDIIDRGAFSGCENLMSVTLSDSLADINSGAFGGCKNLRDFTVGDYSCTDTLKLPEALTRLGGYAFEECPLPPTVYIPMALDTIIIYEDPFRGCPIENIKVDSRNQHFVSEDGVLFDKKLTRLISYPREAERSDYTLPPTVTYIPSSAFAGCQNLTSITIPGDITTIRYGAFRECENLTSVNLPETLTSIDFHAFELCRNLKTIKIPDSVTELKDDSFYGCGSLTSVHLPDSLDKIGERTFKWCTSLQSIDIPDGTRFIGNSAFVWCNNLKTVTLPASLEAGAVTSWGYPLCNYQAFGGCGNIEDVYYKAENPVAMDSTMFSLPTYENAILHVPSAAVEKAAVTLPWSKFKTVIAHDFSNAITDIVIDSDEDGPVEVYKLNGIKVANSTAALTPGIYIVRQGRRVKKIAVNDSPQRE